MTPAQVAHIMALMHKFSVANMQGNAVAAMEHCAAVEAALRDAPQAEGWVMVPVEPTPDMRDAGGRATRSVYSGVWREHRKPNEVMCAYIYRAMLAATPSAPTAAEPDERAGWEVIKLGQRPAACDGATSWSCCDTGRCDHDNDNARADASWREFDAARASKGTK